MVVVESRYDQLTAREICGRIASCGGSHLSVFDVPAIIERRDVAGRCIKSPPASVETRTGARRKTEGSQPHHVPPALDPNLQYYV